MSSLLVDIYVRTSRVGKRENAGTFQSFEEQEQKARAFAAVRGLEVGEVIEDKDWSGAVRARPGMEKALARVRAGESAGIIVAWLDRLARDSEVGHGLLREFEAAGGRVYAPDAPADMTTPEGELQVGVFLLFAQYTRRRLGGYLRSAKERAIAEGRPVGEPPTGYRRVQRDFGERKGWVFEPDEHAPAVRELFERRARGEGLTPLADFMTEATGKPWSRQGVRATIRRRTYLGHATQGDLVNAEAHEPIVDEPLWLAAQAPANRPVAKRAPSSPWLLSGILRCDACDRALAPWSSAKNKQGKRFRRYRCPNRQCAERASVRAPLVEAFVTDLILGTGRLAFAPEGKGPDTSALEAELRRAEERLAQAETPEAQDALGDRWLAAVKERRQARDQAAEALGRARSENGDPGAPVPATREAWDALPVEERRAVIAAWFPVVTVAPGDRIGVVKPADAREWLRTQSPRRNRGQR